MASSLHRITSTASGGIYYTNMQSAIDHSATTAGECYNLNGQRVNAPVKGINIVGGKKVLVK